MSDQHDQRMASIFSAQDVSVVTPEALKRMLAHRAQQTAHQDRRLAGLFGQDKVPKVTEATLASYLAYLTQHLAMPCLLTGLEDRGCFAWETYYTFGPGNKQEYAQRKKKQASYTDTYALLGFEVGCPNRRLAVDRFLDSRCQRRHSDIGWPSTFHAKGLI